MTLRLLDKKALKAKGVPFSNPPDRCGQETDCVSAGNRAARMITPVRRRLSRARGSRWPTMRDLILVVFFFIVLVVVSVSASYWLATQGHPVAVWFWRDQIGLEIGQCHDR